MSAHQQQLRGPSFPSQQQQQQQHKINANGDNQPQHAQEHKPATANASTKKRKASPVPSSTDRRRMSTGIYPSTDDDAASTSSKPVREPKRTRVHFSCVECHRRKQKCDRKEPCSQCVARRVPHLCRPFLNGVEDPNVSNNTDVNARLNTIENLLTRLISSIPQAIASRPFAGDTGSPDVSSLTASGEEIFHPHATPPDPAPRVAMPHKPPPSGLFPSNMSYTTPTSRTGYGWGLREGRRISLSLDDNFELRDMLQTLKESGVSQGHLEWLIAGVPGRRMADGLVELYFRDIDWTRYKINKFSFMSRYNKFFESIGRNPSCPKVDADTLKWLPLMFILLAIAALSAPHELVPRDEQLGWSRRFYGSARSGLEYAKALQRDNLDVLFAGLLASRYMLLTRRPAEGSAPLTTAFQLGLYRDGSVLNISDKKEVEIRRRAWAMLYHIDRTISLLVGRPASISDAHTDTQPPANLDDEEVESGDFDPAGHPLTTPTSYTYVIVRHKLAEIMGRIAYHTFAIQLPDYGTVVSLDRELLAWRDNLPSFFRMENPDTSLDQSHPYLFVQRHLLACEWYYTRITLNRPYLLRRKPQDSRYAYSKTAAIESAKADLLCRRAFVMEKGNLVVNSGGYRVLNSYMVLGVTIKLDPDSPQADELRQLLNVVSGRLPDSQNRISEPLVKEELAIVEFLTAKNLGKSSRLPPNRNAESSVGAGDDQTPVDLLLNLAKTRSGKRAAEEEKRQLRLQAAREKEEQRQAAKRNAGAGNISSSPWGYVAPPMPGLDVQQPFDNDGKRVPRPLQPPPTRRADGSIPDSTGWSPEMALALSQTPLKHQSSVNAAQAQAQALANDLQRFDSPNQNRALLSPSQGTGNLSLSPYGGFNSLPSLGDTSGLGGFDGNAGFFQSQPPPPLSLSDRPSSNGISSNPSTGGQGQGPQGGMLDGNGVQQFGNANFDSFDFNDLGLDVRAPGQGGGFNPFALPQTEEGNAENNAPDDETMFLTYILNKFANAQPEL
ncbi:nuclear protein [Cryptococcus neoformans Tu401-1]|nr:nuclear protein [Cryptococcus neoformans var. grubii Tu401-1]